MKTGLKDRLGNDIYIGSKCLYSGFGLRNGIVVDFNIDAREVKVETRKDDWSKYNWTSQKTIAAIHIIVVK